MSKTLSTYFFSHNEFKAFKETTQSPKGYTDIVSTVTIFDEVGKIAGNILYQSLKLNSRISNNCVFKLDNIGTYTVSINQVLDPTKLKVPILLESSIGTENNLGKSVEAIFEWIPTNTSEGYIGKISLISQ